MKYYSLNGWGFFKSNSESDTFRMSVSSILYGNESPTCIEDLSNYTDWKGEQKKWDLIHIRSKYKLAENSSESEIYNFMIKNEKIIEISEVKFNQLLYQRVRFKETTKYIRDITIKKSIEILIDFLKKNEIAFKKRYDFLGESEMQKIKTKRYWNQECKHSHSLVKDWIYFDLPIVLP